MPLTNNPVDNNPTGDERNTARLTRDAKVYQQTSVSPEQFKMAYDPNHPGPVTKGPSTGYEASEELLEIDLVPGRIPL